MSTKQSIKKTNESKELLYRFAREHQVIAEEEKNKVKIKSLDSTSLEIFTELRQVVNKPTIYYIALVKHNEKSLALPIGVECPSYYGVLFLDAKGGDIINTQNETPYSYISACKDLGVTHPNLIQWFDRDKRWHKVKDYNCYQAGNKFYSTVIPRDETTYFHVEYRDD